jgi:hypothetical protein
MKQCTSILLFAILTAFSVSSQNNDDSVVYGPNWAYLVSTPPGFKQIPQSLKRQGIWSLYIEEGQEEYREDQLRIYIKVDDMDTEEFQGIELEMLKNDNQGMLVKHYGDMELGDFSMCEVYSIDKEKENTYMLNGYIKKETIVFNFILKATSKEERQEHERAYRELLESFVYLSEEPTTSPLAARLLAPQGI